MIDSKEFNHVESPKLNHEDKEKENSADSKLELMKQEITQSDQIDISEKNANVVSSSIYKCGMCTKRFSSKLKFQQHCLVHSVEDNESLTCNVCLKTFLNNSSLSRHSKTHQSKTVIIFQFKPKYK